MRGVSSCVRAKCVCAIFGPLFLIVLVFVGQLVFYILSEFVFRTHRGNQSVECIGKRLANATIPQHIHQIFFFITDKELPKIYQENQKSWRTQNPGYNYTLWNATMIEELIQRKYPDIEGLYHSYKHWVRRADVARYLVLHQFGGIYVDIDLECKKPLSHLIDKVNSKGIVMYESQPVGYDIDLLATEPHHPFLKFVINGLKYSNRWYIFPHANAMLTTGPGYFFGRYLNFDRTEDMHAVSDEEINEYINRTPGFSWYGWDSATIQWYRENSCQIILIFKLILGVICSLLCLKWIKRFWYRFQQQNGKETYIA